MKHYILLLLLIVFSVSVSAQKVILAKVEIKEERLQEFISETNTLVELTKKEENCLSFNINQEKARANVIFIHEIFKDEKAFKAHLGKPYVKKWFKNLETMKASELEITELQTLKTYKNENN